MYCTHILNLVGGVFSQLPLLYRFFKNIFKSQEHFRCLYSHYYMREKTYCTRTSVSGAFLCPENKTQVKKTENEAFYALAMKLYYPQNQTPYRENFPKKSARNTTLKERIERMPPMTKKRKEEWALFLNERNRITHNPLCRRCRLLCKQSFRAEILVCPNYYSKRSKEK